MDDFGHIIGGPDAPHTYEDGGGVIPNCLVENKITLTITSENKLNRTRTYLVGQMQYMNGAPWREYVQKKLENIGIIVFNPYNKPFINSRIENSEIQNWLKSLMVNHKYDEVSAYMKVVRSEDLRLCDIIDFGFIFINPKFPSVGAWEELFWVNRQKKPIFCVIDGGKENAPLWLLGTIPHKYIYNSIDEALDVIYRIDNGVKEIDSDRWRLLKKEYR